MDWPILLLFFFGGLTILMLTGMPLAFAFLLEGVISAWFIWGGEIGLRHIADIPSVLRRRYKIDHLPVRGEVRVKVWLGFKISAINRKRLIKGLMNRLIPELSTLLYNHLFSLISFQRTSRVKFAA